LSTVMLQNVMFLKKKNYHETIKDGDMVLQNEPARITPKTWKPVYRSSFLKTDQESRK